MQKDKEPDNSEPKTHGGEMVRKASSASISSQKRKQTTNKNKKRNYDRNKKKAP